MKSFLLMLFYASKAQPPFRLPRNRCRNANTKYGAIFRPPQPCGLGDPSSFFASMPRTRATADVGLKRSFSYISVDFHEKEPPKVKGALKKSVRKAGSTFLRRRGEAASCRLLKRIREQRCRRGADAKLE